MSNYVKLVEFLKDPKLCDPERPVKPHKYWVVREEDFLIIFFCKFLLIYIAVTD